VRTAASFLVLRQSRSEAGGAAPAPPVASESMLLARRASCSKSLAIDLAKRVISPSV